MGLAVAIALMAFIPLPQDLNRATEDIKYTELSYLLNMDGLKLRGRSGEDLENEIKSVKAICSDIKKDLH
jgi:hypothetical protein